MPTLLPAHDQFALNASPQRDTVPAFTRTAQAESQPFSQIIKDQQQAKLRDLPPETNYTPTASTNDLREAQSNFKDREEIASLNRLEDSPSRVEKSGELQKIADNSEGKSFTIVHDERQIESQDSQEAQAQDQADSAQSQPARPAETDNGEVPSQSDNKSISEDSNQGSNDVEIVQNPEIFGRTQSSKEAVDASENPISQTIQEPVTDSELLVGTPSQTNLTAELSNPEAEAVSGDRVSSADTDTTAITQAKVPDQSQASSHEAITGENAESNQLQEQAPAELAEGNLIASNQIVTNGSSDKQESAQALPQQQSQQANSQQANSRLDVQPVHSEPKSVTQSNSQVSTQANIQTNQATGVTVGQEQQQSSTGENLPDKGYSEPRTDDPKVKSNGQQQAKLNLPQTQEAASSRSVASARAAQLDTAIRIENATGQPATVQVQAKPAVQVVHGSVSSTNGAEGQALNLSNSSADPVLDPAHTQILRGLTATLNQRGGALTMRLDPPDLGQLRIQMSILRGIVTANFQVQTPQAQELLERSLATLRTALQGQGLTVERLTVQTTPQQSNAQTTRHESDQQTSQQRQQHDAGQGESKGRRDDQSQNAMSSSPQFRANEYATFDLLPQPAGAD